MTAHFEAKKHAYRQTQDGIVISFVVHPNDVSAELATAALGTRYMVAFSEIGEDGKPMKACSSAVEQAAYNRQVVGSNPTAPTKDRKPFNTLPLAQQIALRCNDQDFQRFLGVDSTEAAAEDVRQRCRVTSRSDVAKQPLAKALWDNIEINFGAYLTDLQYADSKR